MRKSLKFNRSLMMVLTKLSLCSIALAFAVMLLPGTAWGAKRPLKRPDHRPGSAGAVNTVYFFDDFENGLSKWTESTGFWETATCDYRSTTTSVSATDSCSTNYPQNVNASLTLTQSYELNLSGATSPVLTFWHKYSIASTTYCCYYTVYDYGYVEYSTDYGVAWNKLTNADTQKPDSNGPGFTGTISSWYPEEFDLTQIPQWNTLPILIRFRLWDGGYTNQSWGWLIDDVEVREKGSTLNVGLTVSTSPSGGGTVTGAGIDCPGTCSELWPANWTLSGRDWASEDTNCETQPACMSAVPDYPNGGNYARNADSVLEQAAPVSIAGATAPTLSIYTQYSIASTTYCCYTTYYDYGYVEYSTNYGLTWTKLKNQDTQNPDGNGPGFTGTVSSWTQEQFDLTQITNWQTLPIQIRFRLWDGGYTNQSWGWLIDDPEIYDPATGKTYFGPDTFGSGSLPDFSNVTLTATPNNGYIFESWAGCNSTSGNECTINRYIDRAVTANFSPPPDEYFNPEPVTFATPQLINTKSAPQTVTFYYNGSGTLTLNSIVSTSSEFILASGTCNIAGGTKLTNGQSCTFTVTFDPTAINGQSATITANYSGASDGTTSYSETASGTGTDVKVPKKLTFKTIAHGTTETANLKVTNGSKKGGPALHVTGTQIGGTNGNLFTVTNNGCASGVAAGKSCNITIQFAPTQAGKFSATITLTTDGGSDPSVPLAAKAT